MSAHQIPARIDLQFFTKRYIRTVHLIEQILDFLESESFFAPTKYGEDGPKKIQYDRTAFLNAFLSNSSFNLIYRDKSPKYDISLPVSTTRLDALYFHFEPAEKAHVSAFYQLSVQLAELFEPVFGTVQSDWMEADSDEVIEYRRTGTLSKPQFSSGGPAGFATRTWFGSELAKKIGQGRVAALNKPFRWTNYGGFYIDTVIDVTQTQLQTTLSEQKNLTHAFADLEIWGDYTKFYNAKPGPTWVKLKKEKTLF